MNCKNYCKLSAHISCVFCQHLPENTFIILDYLCRRSVSTEHFIMLAKKQGFEIPESSTVNTFEEMVQVVKNSPFLIEKQGIEIGDKIKWLKNEPDFVRVMENPKDKDFIIVQYNNKLVPIRHFEKIL